MTMHVDIGDESIRRWQEERRQAALELIERADAATAQMNHPDAYAAKHALRQSIDRAKRAFR